MVEKVKKPTKTRLDALLHARGIVPSRKIAQSVILSGNVLVNDNVISKAGTKVDDDADIRLKKPLEEDFVSRGGKKLKGALEIFSLDVNGFTVLDAGASTGGFTDCLLKMGAKKIYAVDVGYGQLAYRLQTDDRVVVIDRTNIRYLEREKIPEAVDLAVIDLSFISLKKVLNNIVNFVKNKGSIIALIKPQFEAGRENVGKGGIVKDKKEHERVIEDIKNYCESISLTVVNVIPSPILGTKGNKEFLIHLTK
ncbi:TlyA family RNA methyltransferase [Thermodesulfobacteriota bacterium]